ncbi:MAG: lantibiotic dehydratase [Rhodanobacter sp.]
MNAHWKLSTYDFALLRTPLMPDDLLYKQSDGTGTQCNEQQTIEMALRQIKEVMQNPIVMAAVSHASTSLGARIEELDPSDLGRKNLKLACSLYKYASRMSTRCTPFGALATVSMISAGVETKLRVDRDVRLHSRLDNHHVWQLARSFNRKLLDAGLTGFRVAANNTIYFISNELRRVLQEVKNKECRYRLGAVRSTNEIKEVLDLARTLVDVDELIKQAAYRFECSTDDARGFIREMLDRQLLTTELNMALTSGNCFDALIAMAKEIPLLAKEAEYLHTIQSTLAGIDQLGNVSEGHAIPHVVELLSKSVQIDDARNLIHIDAYRDAGDSTIGSDDISRFSEDLAVLLPFLWHPFKPLEEFTKKFVDRYGDAEVPLLEALDSDTGIRFGPVRNVSSPLLAGALSGRFTYASEVDWGPWQQFMLEKIIETRDAGSNEVVLTRQDCDRCREHVAMATKFIETTFTAHFSLLANTGLGNQPCFLLNGLAGPSAIGLLARFGCGDTEISNKIRLLAEDEQASSDKLIAEIIHVPDGRMANILTRPMLRDAEIVYGTVNSSLCEDNVIQCNDLMLRSEGGRLRIRSKKKNRDITPRLASAHNSGGHNLPLYQFLTAMQYVDGYPKGLPKSDAIESLSYLPRIRFGSVIISLARWVLNSTEIERLCDSVEHEIQLRLFAEFRKYKKLPRFINLVSGDNALEIDLDNSLGVLTLLSEIKGFSSAVLRESLCNLSPSCVDMDGRPCRNEVLLPFRARLGARKPFDEMPQVVERGSNVSLLKSKELPLEKWIYFDIFTGETSAENLLTRDIWPVLARLRTEKVLERWFYVRYYVDGIFQLRLRALPGQTDSRVALLDSCLAVLRPFVDNGLIHKVQISGYARELDRYGGAASLDICEEVFHAHSEIAVQVLSQLELLADREEKRWVLAFVHLWSVLIDSLGSLDEVIDFAQMMVTGYRHEMPSSAHTAKAVSENFRIHRKVIESELSTGLSDKVNDLHQNSKWAELGSHRIRDLRRIHGQATFARILGSILHMDCNRIFSFHARANEMILYEYVLRYARSVRARTVNGTSDFAALVD